ncbi:MAG TPA: B12-binding domain-containing radical SAM protein, partial [Thermoanaerobaculia bacterium]|nr:B12-binding domain-containing radical SAM protein [Thermoanaerobaculia bacterium]
MSPRRFCLILVKPSHYDDDGYVIQWFRSAIPSNSLAALYGLARDCATRRVLGDLELEIHPIDETNTRVRPEQLARMIEDAGSGMVMLVGVQSNQFPRALDLARPLRARGITVAVGGFHVSGVMSMLGGDDPDLHEAKRLGITLFAGEAEGRLDEVLRDAAAGALKPVYNYMTDLPSIEGTPIPLITALRAWRTAGGVTSFDAGRGCPFQCSFCTIINVQGRKSRRRSPDDVERIVRENVAQGLHSFFITDDNFARNSDWEPILDRLIELKEQEGIKIHFIIQVDTLCHKIPRFVEKCARAGVRRVFIGLENINPDSLVGAKKRQNKIAEYRKMLLAWKAARVITYAGYILGFPNDTPESIRHDIEIIKRELPVDLLEFFFLTPLPGSEDHQTLVRNGVAVDADLNKYDLNHVCTAHPKMSAGEWEATYRMAWQTYYTKEHVETVIRRNVAMRCSASNAILLMTWFGGSIHIEGVHPLEAGLFRYKYRRDRRPGFAIEAAWKFYPSYAWECIAKLGRWFSIYAGLRWKYMRVKRDPRRYAYIDTALTPVTDDDQETLELFHETRPSVAFRSAAAQPPLHEATKA